MAMLEWVPVRPTWRHLTLPLNPIYTAKKQVKSVNINAKNLQLCPVVAWPHSVEGVVQVGMDSKYILYLYVYNK